jgi:hypothetical protein
MSAYNFEEPPFDTVGPSASVLSPLAQAIEGHLVESGGVVSLTDIQQLALWKGHTLVQLNEALRQLQQREVNYCASCKSLISQWTGHQGFCPHGA